MKPCKSNEIRNPATNRCVKKSGKIGKKLLRSRASPRVSSPRRKPCKSDEIRNPATKRCVKKSGKIGKALLKKSPAPKKSPKKKSSPKKISRKKSSPKKEMGFDPIMHEDRPVAEFLKENRDNIVIRIKDTNYLSSKDYFNDQGIFMQCTRVARTDPIDIYKSIDYGRDNLFHMNAVGIPGGYVYLADINMMIISSHQTYTIKPTTRKTVSIVSKSIADILRMPAYSRPQGYLVSAVHCGPGEQHVIHKLVKI